jgi:hypothetical protein
MWKKFFWFIIICCIVAFPWYKKYVRSYFYKYFPKRCSLIQFECTRDSGSIDLCAEEDLHEIIKIIGMYDPKVNAISKYSKDEQYVLYKKIIENYFIDPYIVQKYLEELQVTNEALFIKDKKMFMKIMENNFHINFFKRLISEQINIEDDFAKEYYYFNRVKLFNKKPFVEIPQSVNARIIEIKDSKEDALDYKVLLLDDSLSHRLYNFNPYQDDSKLSMVLRALPNGEYDIVLLDDGKTYMVYKIDSVDGVWFPYEKVKEHIKKYIHDSLINEKIISILEDMKQKCDIKINEKMLYEYIESKTTLGNEN